MKFKTLTIALFTIISISCYSQEHKRTIGLSGTIQQGQFGIAIPIWTSSNVALVPAFEVKWAEKIGSDIGIGFGPRLYFKNETLAPYMGFKAGMLINIPSSKNEADDETKIDYLLGLNGGAEYFIGDQFSLGVEIQANVTKSDKNSHRFGNPDGLNFNTATMISATIYF